MSIEEKTHTMFHKKRKIKTHEKIIRLVMDLILTIEEEFCSICNNKSVVSNNIAILI